MTPKALPALFIATALTLSGVAVATAQTVQTDTAEASEPMAKRGDRGMRLPGLMRDIDANGDGAITQAELDAYRTAQLAEADTSGDGALTLEEFGAIYDQALADRRVDAFQRLDADGDGTVTQAELDAQFGDMVARFDRNGDGQIDADDRRGQRDGPRRGK